MAAMQKESFILYTSHGELVNKLTDEQAGQLLKGIFLRMQNINTLLSGR